MTYDEALDKIHSLLTFGSRPGLDRMRILLDRLQNPQDRLKFIHVAGTNGKGSVCAALSSTLVAAGYKTGLFISPYITDFRERIQINNSMISKKTLADAVESTFPIIEQLSAEGVVITEFEYVNALEFYIHAQESCDIVVLETGMGGLLDCTNTIKPPLCSVITTIGLDHTAVLGDAIEEITRQKCGILKQGSMAVTSAQDRRAMSIIERTALSLKIPLAKSENTRIEVMKTSLSGSEFVFDGNLMRLPLAGEHQIENAKTAITALEMLRLNGFIDYSGVQLAQGIANAQNPARLETLCKSPVVLLDGAHNPNGIEALRNALEKFLRGKYIIGIVGMLADKDVDSSVKLMSEAFDCIYAVPVNNTRAVRPALLAQKCSRYIDESVIFESARHAFDAAFEKAKCSGCAVVVCGSLYLAGEIRPYIIDKVKNK